MPSNAIWSQPDLIRGIHHDYLQAGAEIIETNTFVGRGVHPQRFPEFFFGRHEIALLKQDRSQQVIRRYHFNST